MRHLLTGEIIDFVMEKALDLDRENGQDVGQEALYRILKGLDSGTFKGGNIRSWCFVVLKNTWYSYKSGKRYVGGTMIKTTQIDINHDKPVTMRWASKMDVAKAWEMSRNILTQKQFRMLTLKHQGYSSKEISEIEGLSRNWVRQSLCKIRKKLSENDVIQEILDIL